MLSNVITYHSFYHLFDKTYAWITKFATVYVTCVQVLPLQLHTTLKFWKRYSEECSESKFNPSVVRLVDAIAWVILLITSPI